MVTKVTRSHGADSSGIFRRPRLVLKLKRFEDLPTVLSKTKSYPTPIRMVGADYSQTRCVGGDGGTTVDTTALDKIIEFGETFVRAQAGVRVGALVHALAERGLERPLTPVKIDYQVLSLKEFSARFTSLINAPGALRLHISPFTDKITVERRTLDESASVSRSGIWQIRNSVMRNVLPAFGSTVGSVRCAPLWTGARAAW